MWLNTQGDRKMANAVTITREYSGFSNAADTFRVGDFEHYGNASASDYALPNGYNVDGLVVRDPDGYQCAIVLHTSGCPQLISLAGKIKTSPVLSETCRFGVGDYMDPCAA
jgi:hypothetical protein